MDNCHYPINRVVRPLKKSYVKNKKFATKANPIGIDSPQGCLSPTESPKKLPSSFLSKSKKCEKIEVKCKPFLVVQQKFDFSNFFNKTYFSLIVHIP